MVTDLRQLDAGSIADSFRRMEEEARAAAELMEVRIAHQTLDGDTEVELLSQSLERTRIMSMEVSEILDACERRYRGR